MVEDRLEQAATGGLVVSVEDSIERELDRVRIQRFAVVKFDIRTQVELPVSRSSRFFQPVASCGLR